MATASHGARLAVGSFARLLRGNVNRLARLAKAAPCGWGIPHGHRGGAGGAASLHTGSPCRFSRRTVWRMRGADTGFACRTLDPRARRLLPPQIFEAPSVMSSRVAPLMGHSEALFLHSLRKLVSLKRNHPPKCRLASKSAIASRVLLSRNLQRIALREWKGKRDHNLLDSVEVAVSIFTGKPKRACWILRPSEAANQQGSGPINAAA